MSQTYHFPPPPEAYRPTVVPFAPPVRLPDGAREVTPGRVFKHLLLLGLTGLTTTAVGALLFMTELTAEAAGRALGAGILFSFTLLSILGSHEMGPYLACRWYGVRRRSPSHPGADRGRPSALIKSVADPGPARALRHRHRRPARGVRLRAPGRARRALLRGRRAALRAHEEMPSSRTRRSSRSSSGSSGCRRRSSSPGLFAAWVGLLMTSLNLLPSGSSTAGT